MRGYLAQVPYPVVLAGIDLAVGGVLYYEVSAALGLTLVGVGVVLLCTIASQLLRGVRGVLSRRSLRPANWTSHDQ